MFASKLEVADSYSIYMYVYIDEQPKQNNYMYTNPNMIKSDEIFVRSIVPLHYVKSISITHVCKH